MIKSYFKAAWRNVTRNKSYSVLNVFGLATGMAVALLIGLWVHYHYSYDRFLTGHQQVYKVGKQATNGNGENGAVLATPLPLADALKKDVPGVRYVAHTDWMKSHGLMVDDKKIYIAGGMVGGDFLKIFQYPLLNGNSENVLKDPYSIVLSESTAKALFGSEDPLNKIVRIDNKNDLKVTGIMKDVPANSTLQFNFLVPFDYYFQNDQNVSRNSNNWGQVTFQTFVSLQPNVSYAQVSPALKKIIAKYSPEEYKQSHAEIFLQPMDDWHLYNEVKSEFDSGGFIEYVKMFSVIGILILLIACINFINLSTASSEKRAKEVGIRKAIGSLRAHLIYQFLIESLVIVLIAFILSLVLVQLALPAFNQLAASKITIPYSSPGFWSAMMVYVLITGLIAGSRPAFYLSSFRPIKVLKGNLRFGKISLLPRKILVVLQFSCSIILIISTIVIYRQIQHAKGRATGYDANRLVMTDASADLKRNYRALKNDLLQSGVVSSVTQSSSPVTEYWSYNGIDDFPGKLSGENVSIAAVGVPDADYFNTMGMQIKEGRNFKDDNDSVNVVLNETAVKHLRLRNPVNQMITWDGNERVRVIGVVNDALISSPFSSAVATLFSYKPGWSNIITYRLLPNIETQQAIQKLSAIFDVYNPSSPYIYNFIDEKYAEKFRMEMLMGKLAGIFAVLAIFISCLGLFGLASCVAGQRTKEMGIRKVLGASVYKVWMLLSKDFIILVFISCLIASPVALYFLQSWLQKYDYRISIGPGVFLGAGMLALLITIMTISFQAIKAAVANPVKSLRTE